MGADILAGIIVSMHAVLGYWISFHLVPRQSRFRQLILILFGVACGMALGFALSYLLITLLLRAAIPALNTMAILSWVLFILPFVLIYPVVEWHTERKSHDYQVLAGFLALLAASIISFAVLFLLYEVPPSSFSFAFYFGIMGGMLYTRLLLSLVVGLATRDGSTMAPPAD